MTCLVCLKPLETRSYHARCAGRLFGNPRAPEIDVRLAELATLARTTAGRTTLPGADEQLSLGYTPDRRRLVVTADRALFLLKPQSRRFAEAPENEHVTMLLAAEFGLEVAAFGLVRLPDDSLAFLVRRLDRTPDAKVGFEDFCQLAELGPAQKYDGSAELCVRLLQRHASEPLADLLELFRRIVFGFWTGNGELHLKNLALIADPQVSGRRPPAGLPDPQVSGRRPPAGLPDPQVSGRRPPAGLPDGQVSGRLAPACSLVNSRLANPDAKLALSIGGKRERLKRADFERLAAFARIPPRAAARVLDELARFKGRAFEVLSRSLLSEYGKSEYRALIDERTPALEK